MTDANLGEVTEVAKRNRHAELDGRRGRVVWHLILSGETAAAGLLIDA